MTKNKTGKVIPFTQSANFYMKRGAKELEKNDLIAAIAKYREAYERAPEDAEIAIALAEILSQMQRFEESNRILFRLLADREDTPAECHFGLACNYFGMQDYDRAADSLEDYLELEPDGEFAADAEDFLDLIDDDDAMFETTGLRSDDDYEDNAVNHFARSLLASGEANYAVEELEHRLSQTPDSLKIKEQLTIAYFVANRRDDAKKLANELIAGDATNVLANSTLALAEIEDGNRAAALARLDEISKIRALEPEELHSIAVLQLDLELFEDADKTLTQMMHLMPYDENVLHKLAYTKFMQGDAEAAKAIYQKLLRIDPHDTVAKYYLNQSKHTDNAGKHANAKWIIPYQVPFSEAFRRLNHLNRMLALPHDELNRTWMNDVSFRDLLMWAISLSDLRVKRSMLSLVFTFADENAQHILRDFLLRTDQPDELKRAVFGMLKHLGAKEPYMAYLNGRWIKGRVSLLELDYKLPASYEGVMQTLMQYMLGNCPEECASEAAHIFQRYVDSLHKKFPRISAAQEISFAAALEYLGRLSCGETVTQEEIGEVYRVTKSRLRNAVVKLEPFVVKPKETE
ncbi:MAG: tetratricopeptide repeat protein [Christensenella sp.]|nr:tetratricopeptide repeat protein [Christensenella sp.]